MGECSIDHLYGSKVRELIPSELRSRDCFDKEFNLKQKDKLDIVTQDETYSFELRRNGWQIFHPEIPNAEHKEYAKGELLTASI